MTDTLIFAMQRSTRGLAPVLFTDYLPRDKSRIVFATKLPEEWRGWPLTKLAASYYALQKAGKLPPSLVRAATSDSRPTQESSRT